VAEGEVVHAVGEMINGSTLTKEEPEINEERSR
jgi:hypothetical protein